MTNQWRIGHGWSEAELRARLAELRDVRVSFAEPPELMTPEHGWTVDGDERVLGHEALGPPAPDGLFARAKQAIVGYRFSDPRIVAACFDPSAPLLGRDMLLEARVLGLRFLYACRVGAVRDEADDRQTLFGYRYDTLTWHVEDGFEWFVLAKDHRSGEVRFRIEARWRLSRRASWWTRLGFLVLGETVRERWRRQAFRRMHRLAHEPYFTRT